MQYKPRTDKEKESVQLSHPESELQSQLITPALQPDDNEVPKPARPEEPRTISVREKAMAASAPGSEYWLP
jgi:hypothetical protein